MPLSSEFEQFDGREVIVLTDPTVLIVFQGSLKITRQVEHFGLRWHFEILGKFLLLPPGIYVVEGRALIYFSANTEGPPPQAESPTTPTSPQAAFPH